MNTDTQRQRNVVIAGGGFTGTSIAIHLVRAYAAAAEQGNDLPSLSITIHDENGIFGPGLPYQPDSDVFLLNQPAYAMSPFPEDPGHFIRWRQDRKPDATPYDFASRAEYGSYLRDIFRDAVRSIETHNLPIRLVTVTGKLADIPADSDVLVLAEGHQKNTLLAEFRNAAGYLESPFSLAKVHDSLREQDGDIAIIGTGQSMVDALAILDHKGFRGTVTAFSPDPILPWAFHPELHAPDKPLPAYEPAVLTPEAIAGCSGETVLALLEAELRHAEDHGYDTGHVTCCKQIREALDHHSSKGVDILKSRLRLLYANPTPPDRHAMLQQLMQKNRLHLVQGMIAAEDIEQTLDGFTIRNHGEDLPVSILFNAACFTRNPDVSPLYRQAKEIEPALDGPHIYAAGPAAHPEKWGVETFRDRNRDIARKIVQSFIQPSL